jgi:two-component system, sensor histidine kinase and response regulator
MAKILVIDDEKDLLEEIVDILTFEGYDVVAASDGREGVQMAVQHLPDLVICDIMMPKMDGYSVLQELRNYQDTSMTPFIFLTAKVGTEDLRRGMNLGADDYLTKPFDSSELMRVVNTRIEKHERVAENYQEQMDVLRHSLVTTLPHELRTPLTGILGAAQVLTFEPETLKPDEILDIANIVIHSGQRLYRLIENYILYSHLYTIEAGYSQEALRKATGVSFPATLIHDLATRITEEGNRYHDLILDGGCLTSVSRGATR